ncbi:unannotated protein [freshwater metagenome]|uniref:Unannotated protein n=1 Tax=freshwater metagenome TaxID=449393 RepID=A0A6J7RW89_9ZZZZ|nr:hypothetical protein [Actinomycetota bacterium]
MTNRNCRLSATALMITLLAALAVAPTASAATPKKFYVSLGDSYAVGFQPGVGSTRNGFVDQLPGLAKSRGYNLKVVNFGCAGASSEAMMAQVGCNKKALAIGATPYPKQTQLAAATKFIKANRSKVALITVAIGGHDVTSCVSAADTIGCVIAATAAISTNVTAAAKALRAAAGPKTKIVGTTYFDSVLGAWVKPGGAGGKSLAELSVVAFQSLINPALKKAYVSSKSSFIDVTAATGAYGDLKVFENFAPYGLIPKPVADMCRLSYYCDKGDIHLRTPGYKIIAKMVAAELPRLK